MRYTIATFALAATAAAVPQYGYQAEESSSAPAYVASSSVPAYAASSSAPAYVASSSAPAYVASSSAPAYAASTPVYSASSVAYPVASSSVKYEEYPVTSTKVVQETTFVCPEPTVITYESHVYSMTKPGTLSVPAYTTTVVVSTKTPEVEKPTSKAVETPVHSASVPVAPYPTSAPYPVSPPALVLCPPSLLALATLPRLVATQSPALPPSSPALLLPSTLAASSLVLVLSPLSSCKQLKMLV